MVSRELVQSRSVRLYKYKTKRVDTTLRVKLRFHSGIVAVAMSQTILLPQSETDAGVFGQQITAAVSGERRRRKRNTKPDIRLTKRDVDVLGLCP